MDAINEIKLLLGFLIMLVDKKQALQIIHLTG